MGIAAKHGPKGVRVGDRLLADGSRWIVVAIDLERREAICQLAGGSRVLHRFRARQILKIQRAAG